MSWKLVARWFHRLRNHAVVRSTGRPVHHISRAVHRLLLLGVGVLVVAASLCAVASWRLAQGPIELGWLADRLRTALIEDENPYKVSFDRVELAWEGFHGGVDHPLDLRISNIVIANASGNKLVAAPDVHLTLSLAGLLLGRIVPRSIEVDRAAVVMTRQAGGDLQLGDMQAAHETANPDPEGLDLQHLQEQLAGPASSDHGHSGHLLDQIRRIHIRDAAVTLHDQPSGLPVRATGMDADLFRGGDGHLRGTVTTALVIGAANTTLTATTDIVPGFDSHSDVRLTPFRPAAIGVKMAGLGQIDLPVSLSASVTLDQAARVRNIRAMAQFGGGDIRFGSSAVPVRGGAITVSGDRTRLTLTAARLDVGRGPRGHVDLSGTVTHASDRLTASVKIGVEQLDIAELPRLWPAGLADGARSWITQHVTGGSANHGAVSLDLDADDDLHTVILSKASGSLDASQAVFTWLDNMPPVEDTEAHFTLIDRDTLDIRLLRARQRNNNHAGDLTIKDSQMRIVGLSVPDQTAEIHVQADGEIANVLALLSEPRLHLLSSHPIGVTASAGEAAAILNLRFPLASNLRIDDVSIQADARLTHVRMPDVAGGHELEDGSFSLGVTKDALKFSGHGSLAAIPVNLDGKIDFTSGLADQVVEKIVVTGTPDATALDAAGLPVLNFMTGPVAATATITQRRNGDGMIAVDADLTKSVLKVSPLSWRKPADTRAGLTANVITAHDRLLRIDHIAVQGDELLVSGSASLSGGHMRSVLLNKIRLGRTQGHGTITFEPRNVINIALQGSQVDLVPAIGADHGDSDNSDPPGADSTNWTLNSSFDKALLANNETARNLLLKASGLADTINTLDAVAETRPGDRFSARIEDVGGKRHLRVASRDAGRLLRGLDVTTMVDSGHLTIDAAFERRFGFYPLTGKLVIDDATVRNSPVVGKLLQAITVYGLAAALRGPGMAFSEIVAPFRYAGGTIQLTDAHASNPSLGLTASGSLKPAADRIAITGTIVPAYFFNSLLGQLPVVGKLFSPEKGGGVFAVRFGLDGSIADPSVTINPISALTPGFLRGIFGVFDNRGPAMPEVPIQPR